MRPVNLIPREERRGEQRQMRTGAVAYIVVGAMVVVLAAVAAIILTNNQIADHKDEVAKLEREDAAAKARAARFAPYTQFHSVREQRMSTITSLADSRFDWERVLRELSRVIPRGVWLTNLSGSASASDASSSGSDSGSSAATDASITGPSLNMAGCAGGGHDQVAAMITALKDIDGITRVGLQSSAVDDGGDSDSGSGSSGDCKSGASFTIVAAFDAAPVPSDTPAPTTPGAPSSTDGTSTPASATTTSGG